MPRRSTSIILAVIAILLLSLSNGCSLNSGDLEIEAQIVYSMGGPQPVARETFYLLNANVEEMTELDKVYRESFYDQWHYQSDDKVHKMRSDFLVEEGRAIWGPHLVQSVKTDFDGRATFEAVKPGDYWVLGRAHSRGDKNLTWNVRVTVKRGTNKLLLSNDNYGLRWPKSGT